MRGNRIQDKANDDTIEHNKPLWDKIKVYIGFALVLVVLGIIINVRIMLKAYPLLLAWFLTDVPGAILIYIITKIFFKDGNHD